MFPNGAANPTDVKNSDVPVHAECFSVAYPAAGVTWHSLGGGNDEPQSRRVTPRRSAANGRSHRRGHHASGPVDQAGCPSPRVRAKRDPRVIVAVLAGAHADAVFDRGPTSERRIAQAAAQLLLPGVPLDVAALDVVEQP